MVRLVVVNGYPESGKDLFAELCDKYMKTYTICTSTPMKEAMSLLGWNGVKTEEVRNELCHMKHMSNKLFNCTQIHLLKELSRIKMEMIDSNRHGLVFIQSREPQEIEYLAKTLGAETVLLTRLNYGKGTNAADMYVEDYDYDTIITNNGSIEDLKIKAERFVWKGNAECI